MPILRDGHGMLWKDLLKRRCCCGRICERKGVMHDLECVQGLVEMMRPETVWELMRFPETVNWMRPDLSVMRAPL